MKYFISVLIVLLVVSCNFFPEKLDINDQKVKPYLKAAASFDRTTYGFLPIPIEATVYLEISSKDDYDVMLHINAKTSRTIALRKIEGGYKWIGEQEVFEGPNQYTSVDGTFHESISLTYEIENVSGFPNNKLNISYHGENTKLGPFVDLSLEIVQPILKEWGY